MSLRHLFSHSPATESIEEAPTPVGEDAFTKVAPYYDDLMATVPYERWVDYVERILARFGARPRDVLDLCCGTGAVGAEMLRRDYQVMGIDLSEEMVRRCGLSRPPLPAAVMDARRFGLRDACFDLVVSLYDSLNYIVEPEGLASCCRGVAQALRPGGLFVFDLNTERALRLGLFTQDNLRSGEPLLYRWESHWDGPRKLCRVDMWFRWRGEGERVEFREIHYERAYGDAEVREMLEAAGLETLAVYDAYSFRAPSRLSNRAYYVAAKP
jgi:SAM-dependent methyltransferase